VTRDEEQAAMNISAITGNNFNMFIFLCFITGNLPLAPDGIDDSGQYNSLGNNGQIIIKPPIYPSIAR
jgi:hypothetical protein